MENMIFTERLIIRIATDDEMKALIENETDEEMKKAYGEMLGGCVLHPEKRFWYAVWFIELKSGERIGDLCFKGLSEDKSTEIGYGLIPEYFNKGYATEAVLSIVEYVVSYTDVKRIEAETDPDNKASIRVLEKVGFIPTGSFGEEGPRFVYKK